jgi:hypothetical protein
MLENMSMMQTPETDEIPLVVMQTYSMLQGLPQNVDPRFLDIILARLAAASLAFQAWMLPKLGEWSPDEILEWGPRIRPGLDTFTTVISDALYKEKDATKFVKASLECIAEMNELYQKMERKGYVINDD